MNVFINDEAVKSIEESIKQAELKEEFSGWIAGKATAFSIVEMIMQSRNTQNQKLEDINFILLAWKEIDKKYCKDKGWDYFES